MPCKCCLASKRIDKLVKDVDWLKSQIKAQNKSASQSYLIESDLEYIAKRDPRDGS